MQANHQFLGAKHVYGIKIHLMENIKAFGGESQSQCNFYDSRLEFQMFGVY